MEISETDAPKFDKRVELSPDDPEVQELARKLAEKGITMGPKEKVTEPTPESSMDTPLGAQKVIEELEGNPQKFFSEATSVKDFQERLGLWMFRNERKEPETAERLKKAGEAVKQLDVIRQSPLKAIDLREVERLITLIPEEGELRLRVYELLKLNSVITALEKFAQARARLNKAYDEESQAA